VEEIIKIFKRYNFRNMFTSTRSIHPFTCIIAGPTKCGKTQFVSDMLFSDKIYEPPEKNLFCYSEWQSKYNDLHRLSNIEFVEGFIDQSQVDTNKRNLIVIDDLMSESKNSDALLNYFTKWSQHRNNSIIFITQNMFNQGKVMRSLSLNTHYMIIFNNPRDKSQITYMAKQIFPKHIKYLVECYNDACSQSYGYLFLDFKQETDDSLRFQSNILSSDKTVVYLKKN
jgi:hypothetical protein